MAIRKGWTVTPAASVNKNQDMVHRAVGRAGVVLVGEGGHALRTLLNDERRKVERFAPGVPVHEVIVGDHDGAISVRKLQRKMGKFAKKLSNAQVRELRARLKSVGGMNIPIPKGPMPKNLRMPKPR
jgi:metallophosphoesterase superfamily enzyme